MPVVMLSMLILYFAAFIPATISLVQNEHEMNWQAYVNPMFTFGAFGIISPALDSKWLALSIVCPLTWSIVFFGLGVLAFKKSDIK